MPNSDKPEFGCEAKRSRGEGWGGGLLEHGVALLFEPPTPDPSPPLASARGRRGSETLCPPHSRSRPRRLHLVARGAHRLDDVLITGAAAEIGREHVEQLLVIDVRILLQRIGGQHQEARRAEAALQRVMRDEGALQWMQIVRRAESLDGTDVLILRLHREHQTRAHRFAVDDHRAGPADAMLAADMRAGLPAVLADGIDQRLAWLDPNGVLAAVDGQGDVGLVGLVGHATMSGI